ncbi:MAG: hypothetical protein IJK27_04115 [Bacilli bacterium]|nr:hypothetical protein [Bacilli bacterium]
MSGPVWCNYCRRYTVNGQCPNCGRIYYINNSSSGSKDSGSTISWSESYSASEGSFWAGFWLAIAINFFAIIIAHKKEKTRMRTGAIVGTIVGAIIIFQIVSVIVYGIYNNWDEIIAEFLEKQKAA